MKAPGRQFSLSLLSLACAALAALPLCAAELELPAPPEPKLPELEAPTFGTPQRLENAAGVIPADAAFHVVAFPEVGGSIALSWELAPGIYLYRKSLSAENAFGTPLPLELPQGENISDEFFGESEVYFERLIARIPASAIQGAPGSTMELYLNYQGCMQELYCYPPAQKSVKVTLP